MSSHGGGIGEPPKRRRGMSSDSDGIGEPPKRRRDEVDRLAVLPEGVLPLVVSNLDTRMAFRTSVLSGYFRGVWKRAHAIEFRLAEENESCNGFMHFVDSILLSRAKIRLRSATYFVEDVPFAYDSDEEQEDAQVNQDQDQGVQDDSDDSDEEQEDAQVNQDQDQGVQDDSDDSDEEQYYLDDDERRRRRRNLKHFRRFINYAISKKTTTLVFGILFDVGEHLSFRKLFYRIPKRCRVQSLELCGIFINNSFATFNFKKLRSLTLRKCVLEPLDGVDKFVDPFPNFECLEELVLKDCKGICCESDADIDSEVLDIGGILKIRGSNLLRLTIDTVVAAKIEIEAPEVTVFSFKHDLGCMSFSKMNLPCLEYAIIRLTGKHQAESMKDIERPGKVGRRAGNLLRGLWNASTIEMDSGTIQCLNEVAGQLGDPSPSTNLKTLVVVKDGGAEPDDMLVRFLFGGNVPDIQYTSIADRPIKVSSVAGQEVAGQEGGTNAADLDNDEGGSLVTLKVATTPKKLTLKSSDGETFEVEEAVAVKSGLIMNMTKAGCATNEIPVPNVTGKILAKVIEYCRKHVEADADKEKKLSTSSNESLGDWDADFVKVEQNIIFDLIEAANYLDIQSLLELNCKAVADMMKGKTLEEIREAFNINNDIPREEEEEVRRENPWAFE